MERVQICINNFNKKYTINNFLAFSMLLLFNFSLLDPENDCGSMQIFSINFVSMVAGAEEYRHRTVAGGPAREDGGDPHHQALTRGAEGLRQCKLIRYCALHISKM